MRVCSPSKERTFFVSAHTRSSTHTIHTFIHAIICVIESYDYHLSPTSTWTKAKGHRKLPINNVRYCIYNMKVWTFVYIWTSTYIYVYVCVNVPYVVYIVRVCFWKFFIGSTVYWSTQLPKITASICRAYSGTIIRRP